MMDGVLENFTGAMLEPYLDGDGGTTDNRGLLQIDPEGLKTWVPALDALGFQPHFHAIGDRAVRESLDAVEAARRANGPSDTRPHIAHIQVIHPDDIGRFRELGVVANAQPLWAAHEDQMDVLTIPFLGRAVALAVPVPVAAGRRRGPGDGLGLERLERRTRCWRWRSRSIASRPTGTRGERGRLPARRAARPDRRARRVHDRARRT